MTLCSIRASPFRPNALAVELVCRRTASGTDNFGPGRSRVQCVSIEVGIEVSLPYGDYYLMEALLRVLKPRETARAIGL